MLQGWVIVAVSFAYLGVLFAIAYYGDKRAGAGRSIIANPYIYAFSLAVYCTTWTFYGSVGRAASSGIGFLPVYLGPTLMVPLWWYVMRKILRISKAYRITSIADFVASRYGKSQLLGGLVTVIAVLGVDPVHLAAAQGDLRQLHDPAALPGHRHARQGAGAAVLAGQRALHRDDARGVHDPVRDAPPRRDRAARGARRGDRLRVRGEAARVPGRRRVRDVRHLPRLRRHLPPARSGCRACAGCSPCRATSGSYVTWAFLTLLSMLSIMFLPRQFQISVVENVDEDHLGKAIWLFPLYLLLINVFVLPVALGGLLLLRRRRRWTRTPSCSRCRWPQQREALALFAFIGGLSAGDRAW